MRKFDAEKLILAYELEQLLYDFAAELDLNDARDITSFYTPDAVFRAGPNVVSGADAIAEFYAQRGERVRELQRDGKRTGRHTFLNVRVFIEDDDNATIRFTNVNYAGEGGAPVLGLEGPSMVADCTMICRRVAEGQWRFAEFAPSAALIGEDDFMKKMLALQN